MKFATDIKAFQTDMENCGPQTVDILLDYSSIDTAPTATGSPVSTAFEQGEPARSGEQLGVLRRIDPARVRVMPMPNRDPAAFESDQFDELLQNILAAGGNSVPISVVEFVGATSEYSYELVSGQRRLRACFQAGLSVLAIVKRDSLIFSRKRNLETLRENLSRQNLSPFEFGRQLKYVIDTAPELSARALARDIGRHHSDVSAAIKLASLPREVIDAFANTVELQYRFEGPLSQALAIDAESVLRVAKGISSKTDRPPAKEIFGMLVDAVVCKNGRDRKRAVGRSDSAVAKPIQCNGEDVGGINFDRRGHAQIRLGLALTEKQQLALHKHVNAFVKRHFCADDRDGGVKNDGESPQATMRDAQVNIKRESPL